MPAHAKTGDGLGELLVRIGGLVLAHAGYRLLCNCDARYTKRDDQTFSKIRLTCVRDVFLLVEDIALAATQRGLR